MDPFEQFARSAGRLGMLFENMKPGDGKKIKAEYDTFALLGEQIRQIALSDKLPALEGRLWAALILTGQLVGTIVMAINELHYKRMYPAEEIMEKQECLNKAVAVFCVNTEAIALYKEYDM